MFLADRNYVFSLLDFDEPVALDGMTHRKVCQRCGEEQRRERTVDDTQYHGESETANAVAAKEEDAEQNEQRRRRSIDCTRKSRVQ